MSACPSHELNTWYDQEGKIVFTINRSLSNVGLDRKTFEGIIDMKDGVVEKELSDTTFGPQTMRKIKYVAPFLKCDRKSDYIEVWHNFEERFANK